MKTIHLRTESASSLVVVISVLATLMVVAGVAAEYTYTVQRHVQRSNTYQNAVAVGDSCLEILFAHWRASCSANALVTKTTADFASIPTPAPSQLGLPSVTNFVKRGAIIDPTADEPADYDQNYTISNYKVVATDPVLGGLSNANSTPKPMLGQVTGPITGTPPKTTPLVFNYVASADVTLPAIGPKNSIVAKVRRVFQKQQISPWYFALFFVDPLEIHPGPDFTITGPVHTNSDLYTGHDTLTFADKVTYASDWFVDFMAGDDTHSETPTSPIYPSNLPPARDQALQPFGLDSTALFNTTDANPNNDTYRELIERPTSSPDPLAAQRYWDQASVVIEVKSDNSVKIGTPNANGTTTDLASNTALFKMFTGSGADLGVKANCSTCPITTNESIQDNREGGSIRLVTLDLRKIQNHTNPLNTTFKANDESANSFNGIVYIYDSSATTHALLADGTVDPNPTNPTRRGVRLKNGSRIASQGLTIVSSNPVYVQGDFNTGRNYDGNPSPASNNSTSDPTAPQVVGYNTGSGNGSVPGVRAPCSILADAVTILSNLWDDAQSANTPDASNTTINAAIVSGIVPTAPPGGNGSYSGGAENFPRFLEDWGDKTLTYYGSMVQLYKSRQSIGEWTCCDVYDPPIRQWYFDNGLKMRPPPGSLMVYSYIKGKWSAQ